MRKMLTGIFGFVTMPNFIISSEKESEKVRREKEGIAKEDIKTG